MLSKTGGFSALLVLALLTGACVTHSGSPSSANGSTRETPVIEASPIRAKSGQWSIVDGTNVSLTIQAPQASTVQVFYHPEAAPDGDDIQLAEPSGQGSDGEFELSVSLPQDFAGDVWADAVYPDGSTGRSNTLSLAARSGDGSAADRSSTGQSSPGPPPAPAPAAHPDKSAFSDEITRGKVRQAPIQPNQPNIQITVNVPAFRLTLWQNGNEVRSYEIGVGQKDFPIEIGDRKAWEIIWNPSWIPPDSVWVNRMRSVEPGEKVEAGDPRNPLGKIKIPLGDGYLIHQIEKPGDIGRLVSHGCIRMRLEDLQDLAEKIIEARGLPVARDHIKQAMSGTDRLDVKLGSALPVEIEYDTLVVENGVLHVYPDVYRRGTNSPEKLRNTLHGVGIDASAMPDAELARIIDRANKNDEFAVSTSALVAGNALASGQSVPLTAQSPTKQVVKPIARRGKR